MTVNSSKAISLGYLMKVSAGNVNASHTEGNVVVTKKVTLPDGSTIPYISGQAIRRMLRDRLSDLGWQLSEPSMQLSGQEVTPPVRPWEFIDEDLFGYLDSSGGRRRTSPVRVTSPVGLYPFWGERDLGTRSFEKISESFHAGGNMFETELYHNVFKGAILIELDRIGVFEGREIVKGGEASQGQELPSEEKVKRLDALLEVLNILWGGGRTARMLSDLSPKFLAYARTSVKHPLFLEAFTLKYDVSGQYLNPAPIESTLERFSEYTASVFFGLEPGFMANEDEIRDHLGAEKVMSVHEATGKAREDVKTLWKSS